MAWMRKAPNCHKKPAKTGQNPAKNCKKVQIRTCPSYPRHPVRRKNPLDSSARAGGLQKTAQKYPPKLAQKSYPQSPSGPVAKNRGVVMPRQQGGGELRRSSFGNQPMPLLSWAQNMSLYGRTRPTSGRSYRFAASSRSSMACSVARRDDRDGHESLLSVDPVSFTVTVSAKEAFLFHLLISPPLYCVPGTPLVSPELPLCPRNSPGTPRNSPELPPRNSLSERPLGDSVAGPPRVHRGDRPPAAARLPPGRRRDGRQTRPRETVTFSRRV